VRRGRPIRYVQGERVDVRTESYQRAFGAVPEGCTVRPSCDEGLCVEPAHLTVVPLDPKMRLVTGQRTPRGGSKLTPEAVRKIRALHAEGVSQGALAQRFGISQPLVSRIVRRLVWQQVV